jgi:hypothetical protein
MAIVVPEARTPEEKAAASGSPATAQEFIRRAKEGYYEAMKNFPSGKAHRAWARQFRRDARSWSNQWRYHWSWHGGPSAPQPAGCHPRMAIALPFLSFLNGALSLLWVCALISLLHSGTILGLELPESIPVWLAALLLFFAYGTVAGSLKAARRMCYWSLGQARGVSAITFLLDAVIWCVVVGALIILAIHFFPAVHDAVQAIPAQIHQATHDIKAWWNGK